MAAKRWIGVAPIVQQQSTLTIGGTVAIGDVFTILCGFGVLKVVAAAAGTAAAATQIQAALAAKTVSREFQDATWAVAGSVVTGTALATGAPFVITASATGAATITVATPVAASGPSFVDVAANYNGSTLPVAGDTLTIEANSPPMLYGLTGLTPLLSKVTFESGFNSSIGLPEYNPRGYREYRPTYLALNASAMDVAGGLSIKIDLGANATALMVFNTGTSNDPAEKPLQVIGGASATAVIASGTVDFSMRATESANFASIVVGDRAVVACGLTCTHTLVRSLGTTTLENTAATLDIRGGVCTTTGQGTQIDVSGGRLSYQSAATITQAYVGPGVLDCSDLRSRTCTTLRMRSGGQVIDPQKTMTVTTLLIENGVKGITAQ